MPTFNYATMQGWASYFYFVVKSFAPKRIKSGHSMKISQGSQNATQVWQAVDMK